MDVDQWAVGEDSMRDFCQLAKIEPRLIDAVHQLRIRILLSEVPSLHQILEDQCNYLQKGFSVPNEPNHVPYV